MKQTVKTTVLILVFMLLMPVMQPLADDDITGHSLENYVRKGVEIGFIQGYGNGVYGPDRQVSRAEFSALIVRAMNFERADVEEADFEASFPDVPADHRFASYIYTANDEGVVRGYTSGQFGPDDRITREQMAVMIHRILVAKGVEERTGDTVFSDGAVIDQSVEFQRAVINTNQYGIVQGHGSQEGPTRFDPKGDATRAQATAFIVRMLDVIDGVDDEIIEPGEEMPPEEEEIPEEEIIDPSAYYYLGRVTSNGEIETRSTRFDTYQEANDRRSGDYPLILHGDHLVKMNSGIVRPNADSGSIIYIYPDSRLSGAVSYATSSAAFSSEFDYIESTEDYVKIGYADKQGYIRKQDAILVPDQLARDKRNYYSVNNVGELVYHYYNSSIGLFSSFNRLGPAPSFLQRGEQYYSWDGQSFSNKQGQYVGTARQYFNTMPVKSKSSYSASDLDDYLENGAPFGVDSPLVGHGKDFVKAQERYGVNALYLMAKAIHESSWGRSAIARDKNNLFGINATDSNPYGNADEFESFEASIMYLASAYVVNGYAHFADGRFNSNMLGHKGQGFNVRYASDMYWGQKIAAHMYRADEYLGGRDANKHTIKFTDAERLNVRKGPGTSHDIMYTYQRKGHPVIVLGEEKDTDGRTWYKITPDHKDYKEAFIRHDFLIDKAIVDRQP